MKAGLTSVAMSEETARIAAAALRRFILELDEQAPRFEFWARRMDYRNTDDLATAGQELLDELGRLFPIVNAESEP